MASEPNSIVGDYKFGFHDPENYVFKSEKGLTREIVESISRFKNEPDWMLQIRLKALEVFESKPMPEWGTDLSDINFQNIHYFVRATEKQGRTWEEVPDDIKNTFDRLGIPEAERKFLAGVSAQYESEVVYHNIRKDLEDLGVLFMDMDTALREYFGTVVPTADNKFAALNTAVWSGGSFIYVPKGVNVEIPLQAYFRINTENMGQFERTLIIVDEGANVHYVEGCTAPTYSSDSLHSAVVEILVKKGGRCRYSTIQNWSTNVYNLVTKRAIAYEDAVMEWIDGNIGSKVTMKFPAVYLMGPRARAEVISVAVAGKGMTQDAGAKIFHFAPDTSSRITSKSISRDGGNTTYRGWIKVDKKADRAKVKVECDALIFDKHSQSHTIPYMDIMNENVTIEHEATVSKVSEEQLFYLMSRGLSKEQALAMVVMGFIEPFAKELPMEYAVELNRLIEMEMEGSVG
jgi:Fe-S cluster assembly protein SufB